MSDNQRGFKLKEDKPNKLGGKFCAGIVILGVAGLLVNHKDTPEEIQHARTEALGQLSKKGIQSAGPVGNGIITDWSQTPVPIQISIRGGKTVDGCRVTDKNHPENGADFPIGDANKQFSCLELAPAFRVGYNFALGTFNQASVGGK